MDDLVFAQGFVTAQDRLWQMDLLRRHAAGQLAAILGRPMLEHDRLQRTLQLRAAADRAIAVLPADQTPLAGGLRARSERLHRRPARPPPRRVPPARLPARPVDAARLHPGRARHVSGPHHRLPGEACARGPRRPSLTRPHRRSLPHRLLARSLPRPARARRLRAPARVQRHPARRVAIAAPPTRARLHHLPVRPSLPQSDPRPLPRSLLRLCRRLQRMGCLRLAHRLGKAAALERHAPLAQRARTLVRGRPASHESRTATPPSTPPE